MKKKSDINFADCSIKSVYKKEIIVRRLLVGARSRRKSFLFLYFEHT